MKVQLPKDERCPLVKLTVIIPGVEPILMVLDDSHSEAEVHDDAIRVEARLCDGRGKADEGRSVIVLIDKPDPKPKAPKYQKTPEPKPMPKPEPPKPEQPKPEQPKPEQPSEETKSEE